jgi:hypothetical protein
MKKVALLICALGVFSLTCFGQDSVPAMQKGGTPPPASKRIVKQVVKPLEIKGNIETFTIADPTKGIRPELSIISEDGKRYTFLVRTTTTIYGPDWKAIALEKLEKGWPVRIQYITNKEGMFVALSIKPVSKEKTL